MATQSRSSSHPHILIPKKEEKKIHMHVDVYSHTQTAQTAVLELGEEDYIVIPEWMRV